MPLGKPELYIGSTRMEDLATSSTAALANVSFQWGEPSRIDFAKPSTLSGELLLRGNINTAFIKQGTPVGLVDPVSGRCLFAGQLTQPRARREGKNGLRISFSASSPQTDLENHTVYGVDWPDYQDRTFLRYDELRAALPRGWTLQGPNGIGWTGSGRLRFASVPYLELVDLFLRGQLYRRHDTSSYTPGAGLLKRLSFTPERDRNAVVPPAPGTAGVWHTGGNRPPNATGIVSLPAGVVSTSVEWEKSSDDTITDVKLSQWGGIFPGGAVPGEDNGDDSNAFDYWMDVYVNNDALQDTYGFRQISLDLEFNPRNQAITEERIPQIVRYWLDADTQWRPSSLELPDSRVIDTAALLNLLAVNSRHMVAVAVTGIVGPVPGKIHAPVNAGEATWTGKKWITTLTLGRTYD